MDRTNFTDEDEGKRIVNAQGDKIGMVTNVEGGTAYVDPDPGLTDTIRSKLGWGSADQDDYRLESSHVSTITNDEIRLSE
jgi:hypothetical protein